MDSALFKKASGLRKMLADQFCHFKHTHGLLPVEYFLQVIVGIDITALFCILKFILFNVSPQTFRNLCTGERLVANDRL